MTFEVNYKLVYELRDNQEAIFAAERVVREAEQKVKAAREAYEEACYDKSGAEEGTLKFSRTMCMAKGIYAHVYRIVNPYAMYGHPENKCIFCGCDDFDDGF